VQHSSCIALLLTSVDALLLLSLYSSLTSYHSSHSRPASPCGYQVHYATVSLVGTAQCYSPCGSVLHRCSSSPEHAQQTCQCTTLTSLISNLKK
jgi:hypothetical protein